MDKKHLKREKRAKRIHYKVRKLCLEKGYLRMIVKKTNLNIYAQIVDDSQGKTLVSYSTIQDKSEKNAPRRNKCNKENARIVGEKIAQLALEQGIKSAAFDRGAHRYHGCVAAIADAAREGGLMV